MTATALHPVQSRLDARRRALRMSLEALARRSGVSKATVRRILLGDHEAASFANVLAVANALGLDLGVRQKSNPDQFMEQQAKQKAQRLVGMVQGTMGLEAQAVDRAVFQRMVNKTTHELLAGPPRKLWSA